jgi:hypothetical protein
LKETLPTKPKTDEAEGTTSANSSPTKSAVQLINYETLLDRLEEYVHSAIENGQNVDRKVLGINFIEQKFEIIATLRCLMLCWRQ